MGCPRCRGEALPRPTAPPARPTPAPGIRGIGDPPDTAPITLPGDCRPWRAGRVRHRLTPTKRGSGAAHPCRHALHRGRHRITCVGARRCLARPRRMARQCTVADTSRPTRSADQPRARLHDRPAVNGRAQSPSRLKPADPNGPRTRPIDPGACAPHSPLQGACGLSPGLQPRAFAADRPGSDGRGTAAPSGVVRPALQAGGSGSA